MVAPPARRLPGPRAELPSPRAQRSRCADVPRRAQQLTRSRRSRWPQPASRSGRA